MNTTHSESSIEDIDPELAVLIGESAVEVVSRERIQAAHATLTDKLVREAACGPQESWVHDAIYPGLALRLRPTGGKSYYFLFSAIEDAGSRREFLGNALDYTVAQARTKANWIENGFRAKTKPRKLRRTMRVNAVIIEYFQEHRAGDSDWLKTVASLFKTYLVPRYGDQFLSGIAKERWLTLIESAALDQRSRGMNLHKALKSFLNWAVKHGLLQANPLSREKFDFPVFTDRQSRDASFLKFNQLCEIYQQAQTLGPPWSTMVGLLMLTGEAMENVRHIQQRDVDWQQGLWTVERREARGFEPTPIKTARLSSDALDLLAPYRDQNGFFFQSRRTSSPINFYTEIVDRLKSWHHLADWGVRDIRRAVRREIDEMGSGPDVAGAWAKRLIDGVRDNEVVI